MKQGTKQAKPKPSETTQEASKVKELRVKKYKHPRKGHIETGKTSN